MGRFKPAAYRPGLNGLVSCLTSFGVIAAMTLGFFSASDGSTDKIFACAWGLRRIELAVFSQSFDGRHCAAVRLHGKVETGFHHFAVEQHGARAALADHAADVRAGEADILAQKMREQNTRLDVFFIKSSVNSDP